MIPLLAAAREQVYTTVVDEDGQFARLVMPKDAWEVLRERLKAREEPAPDIGYGKPNRAQRRAREREDRRRAKRARDPLRKLFTR